MTKRDLFRKTPSQWEGLRDYLPVVAMFTLFILVFMVLIYCQSSVALSHEIGMI
ncbi:hypothetical protein M1M16_gp07 [Methanobacterium virus Drs3]|uniref:Uncharacterized protein n=1 Tax=Methanobacterium virus Drs3 TaxID=1430441 RepID=A0A385AH64_9CAUD|nr:hypothetical protein M1M16_gp07 [Methanobacterium virus Drs3]AXN53388.1 hypothetical protein Drs3_00007 [Methanobacterium virus Drs3]